MTSNIWLVVYTHCFAPCAVCLKPKAVRRLNSVPRALKPAQRTPQLATGTAQPANRFDKTCRSSYKVVICALKGNVNVK
jgi:hypothetical protein